MGTGKSLYPRLFIYTHLCLPRLFLKIKSAVDHIKTRQNISVNRQRLLIGQRRILMKLEWTKKKGKTSCSVSLSVQHFASRTSDSVHLFKIALNFKGHFSSSPRASEALTSC